MPRWSGPHGPAEHILSVHSTPCSTSEEEPGTLWHPAGCLKCKINSPAADTRCAGSTHAAEALGTNRGHTCSRCSTCSGRAPAEQPPDCMQAPPVLRKPCADLMPPFGRWLGGMALVPLDTTSGGAPPCPARRATGCPPPGSPAAAGSLHISTIRLPE